MDRQVLTGRQFNQQFEGKIFAKLTNESENHYGFQYQTGLNIDHVPFNPQGECQPGGLYFFSLNQLPFWLDYNATIGPLCYVRLVTIPDEAQVYTEPLRYSRSILGEMKIFVAEKFKADRLILGERKRISELEMWNDRQSCLEAVEQNDYALKYVKDETEDFCLEAVKKNSYALRYMKNQTEEICLEAVRQDGRVLHFVKDQTEAICLEAIKQNSLASQYVRIHSVFERLKEVVVH